MVSEDKRTLDIAHMSSVEEFDGVLVATREMECNTTSTEAEVEEGLGSVFTPATVSSHIAHQVESTGVADQSEYFQSPGKGDDGIGNEEAKELEPAGEQHVDFVEQGTMACLQVEVLAEIGVWAEEIMVLEDQVIIETAPNDSTPIAGLADQITISLVPGKGDDDFRNEEAKDLIPAEKQHGKTEMTEIAASLMLEDDSSLQIEPASVHQLEMQVKGTKHNCNSSEEEVKVEGSKSIEIITVESKGCVQDDSRGDKRTHRSLREPSPAILQKVYVNVDKRPHQSLSEPRKQHCSSQEVHVGIDKRIHQSLSEPSPATLQEVRVDDASEEKLPEEKSETRVQKKQKIEDFAEAEDVCLLEEGTVWEETELGRESPRITKEEVQVPKGTGSGWECIEEESFPEIWSEEWMSIGVLPEKRSEVWLPIGEVDKKDDQEEENNDDEEIMNVMPFQQDEFDGSQERLLWPPTVIVENTRTGKSEDGRWTGIGNREMAFFLKDIQHPGGKPKACWGKAGHRGQVLVQYPPTLLGLQEAERLHNHFAVNKRSRKEWASIRPFWHGLPGQEGLEEGPDFLRIDEETQVRKRVFYGYLALAHDINRIYPPFNKHRRKISILSRMQINVHKNPEQTILSDN